MTALRSGGGRVAKFRVSTSKAVGGTINEAGCCNFLVGMTLGAIHVSQVPESGRPRPVPPPIGWNLSTNRKRKPKWRRCVAASIAVGPSAILARFTVELQTRRGVLSFSLGERGEPRLRGRAGTAG